MTSSESTAGLRVLVVDDDVDTVESTALLFELGGHKTLTARTGREAVERANTWQPDVILLDLAMPDMDGYQVVEALTLDRWEYAPMMVAVSGYATHGDKRRCAEAGFDLHLTKPVDFALFEQLTGVLAETGRLAQQTRELAATQVKSYLNFIRLEVEMANTLMDVAATTNWAANRARALGKASLAMSTIEKWLAREPAPQLELRAALVALRARRKEFAD